MVLVGRSKFDKNGRISLLKEIADLMDLMDGDYVKFYIENGQVIIRKVTKIYPGGFDLEGEEIKERLLDWESENLDPMPDDEADPETARRMAEEMYKKDREVRSLQKSNKK